MDRIEFFTPFGQSQDLTALHRERYLDFSRVYRQQALPFTGLAPGARGPAVTRLQNILARWNPRLGVEPHGVFDERTERAVALYQAIYTSGEGSRGISPETAGHLAAMENGTFWNRPPVKTPGQELLYQAAQMIGRPYVLGGDGHHSTDCGRLVQMAAQKISPGLSRCADEQYLSACQKKHGLSLSQPPRAGDLSFFRFSTGQSSLAYGGITHVGLHVDSRWTLAASSGAGRVVLQKTEPMRPFLVATGGFR